MNFIRKFTKTIDKCAELDYNKSVTKNGGIAQLARASGSYPAGRWFKSDYRYHDTNPFPNREREYGPVVKRLRHRPFTAVTRVRFSSGSPIKKDTLTGVFFYCLSVRREANVVRRRRCKTAQVLHSAKVSRKANCFGYHSQWSKQT